MITNDFSAYGSVIDTIRYRVAQGYMDLYEGNTLVASIGNNTDWMRSNIDRVRSLFEKTGEEPNEKMFGHHDNIYTLKAA